ncbi:pantetheine-phosphate adenylyltransferase [bacterium]|nr:MAG: pantetheine-phosphate adenylyltransferase [bacterium]
MKKIASVYPGTFDPITNGHLDIIERAAVIFDKVIVTVALNTNKNPLFSKEDRMDMIAKVTSKFKNVKVDSFNGLLVDYVKAIRASVIIRGLRAVSDFEYEFQMSLTNSKLDPNITTIYLMPNEKYTYLNSTLVREIARFGGNVSDFVPLYVKKKLEKTFKS